jgi:hypothetical protein
MLIVEGFEWLPTRRDKLKIHVSVDSLLKPDNYARVELDNNSRATKQIFLLPCELAGSQEIDLLSPAGIYFLAKDRNFSNLTAISSFHTRFWFQRAFLSFTVLPSV